jgi:hypothetical protein
MGACLWTCGWGAFHEPPEVTAEDSIDSVGVDALDSCVGELDSASEEVDVGADFCVLVEEVAEDSCGEDASVAGCSVDSVAGCSVELGAVGVWAGALSAEAPAVVESPEPEPLL